MGWSGVIAAGFLSALVGGGVEVKSTTFAAKEASLDHTLLVMPLNDEQSSSLQFRAVADLVAQKLYERGFRPPAEGQKADYIAHLSYGIDNGTTRINSVPVMGKIGGGTKVTTGTTTAGPGQYGTVHATTTSPSSYGVVGQREVSETTFRREFNLDIYDARAMAPTKVYEVRAVSEGTCGDINAVITAVATGAVAKFPGVNGQPQKTTQAAPGSC